MATPFLDCSSEVSEIRLNPNDSRGWLAADITDSDWVVAVDAAMQQEIQGMARYIERNPLQCLQRSAADFEIPAIAGAMARMKQILDHGVGFCVLDRLPLDQYDIDTMVEIYWAIGQLIGRPVAQKWDGQMIYDVSDTGITHHEKIRGSHTSVELCFHTDNAFARMVPDYVGLLCRQPAQSGGISRFCSLYTVHDRMAEQHPAELERLYQPMYFNRQNEHHPDAPRITLAPYFSWVDDRLNARANSSLVRVGYDIAGEPMDALLVRALDAIDEVCESADIWFEGPLERGQMQYLNNHEVGHYRSEFMDHADPDRKRHLYRLWHRSRGTACYDG